MKVTVLKTLAYTIEVQDADEPTAITLVQETIERGDVSYDEMTECCTEYELNDDDSVDMTLDKDGNNIEILAEYK